MIVTIIGLGLIGGSLALDLKKRGFAEEVIGVDQSPKHTQQALRLNIVDAIEPLEKAVNIADLVIVAIPVQAAVQLLPQILDHISEHTVVTDMGSTKYQIVQAIKEHPKRAQFVASHPMAGTEYSGPNAAIYDLFDEKVAIICNAKESYPKALAMIQSMYAALNMSLIYMEAQEHDMHAAYVSHISHISSFVLATTVLEKEKSVATIFNLASGGFASTVRLAKSSPQMWAPIFEQNKAHVLEVMNTYIKNLEVWRNCIEQNDFNTLSQIMTDANRIRRILDTPVKERTLHLTDASLDGRFAGRTLRWTDASLDGR